jgi:hypothetical protein
MKSERYRFWCGFAASPAIALTAYWFWTMMLTRQAPEPLVGLAIIVTFLAFAFATIILCSVGNAKPESAKTDDGKQ